MERLGEICKRKRFTVKFADHLIPGGMGSMFFVKIKIVQQIIEK